MTLSSDALGRATFAVVIPAFNDEAVVKNAIASAANQPGVLEVIVVDDGSTDATAARARAAGDRVRCISQQNAGPSAARNRGAAAAAATHLIFLDSDDVLLDGAIKRIGSAHNGGARLVRASSVVVEEDGTPVTVEPVPTPHPYPRGTPLAGSFSISATAFRQVGGYDEALHYGENSELLMRLAMHLRPSQVAFLSEPSVQVRREAGRKQTRYDEVRLAAVERMLDVHRLEFDDDPEVLRSHLLIASNLHRRAGRHRDAVRFATRAAGIGALSLHDCYRIGRAMIPQKRIE